MENFLAFPLQHLPFIALVLIIAFTVHEFAHAYSAYKFGDMTAYNEGRVTLNPRVHLDVLGTILILLAGFGWAKPVPVNPSRFKYPRAMGIVVSLLGPVSNLLLAVIGLLIYYFVSSTGLVAGASRGVQMAVETFLNYFIYLNMLLFLFNLIPLPPLDGYRVVSDLLPLRTRYKLEQYAHWGSYIFLLLVFIPPLRRVTLDPYLSLIEPITRFFGSLIGKAF